MPVKMLYGKIGLKIEKDMIAMEDRVNKFEKGLNEQGMQIDNITMSIISDSPDVYCIVHYDSK